MCNIPRSDVKVHDLQHTMHQSMAIHEGEKVTTERIHRVGDFYQREDKNGFTWTQITEQEILSAGGILVKVSETCYRLITRQGMRHLPGGVLHVSN